VYCAAADKLLAVRNIHQIMDTLGTHAFKSDLQKALRDRLQLQSRIFSCGNDHGLFSAKAL